MVLATGTWNGASIQRASHPDETICSTLPSRCATPASSNADFAFSCLALVFPTIEFPGVHDFGWVLIRRSGRTVTVVEICL
ncbi:hypothetical protein CCM_00691 [Cordyceps militaris CM01]|uniref:Uncharacterized protein n=1 Tax=Cordyceps militaris (strain CM01) TaxID=983644 RepID=G3J5H5_CORMM|nr:uncharacterized protein CCM_00691 [Cordyceps militaris CM01]EGX96036.1 hypothetical protein CCM_00691 [Cordyceps militaris CM01]